MRAWWVALGAIAWLGCGSADVRPPLPDAGATMMPPDAVPETCTDTTDPKSVDFYGEACQGELFPVNTECHADRTGWCIDSVCRPMCHEGCPRCPGGAVTFAPAGACYCEPRP